jgi:3-dehydroshikimate dehydratase
VNPATIQYACPSHAPNCQGAPNAALKAPALVSARPDHADAAIAGTFSGAASRRYLVEVFGNTDAGSSEAETFIADAWFATDAAGTASFTMRLDRARIGRLQSITATITSPDGATSPLSAALQLKDLPR